MFEWRYELCLGSIAIDQYTPRQQALGEANWGEGNAGMRTEDSRECRQSTDRLIGNAQKKYNMAKSG